MTLLAKLPEDDAHYYMGTGRYYRHPLSNLVYTDGVNDVAVQGDAYWLIDAIASHMTPKLCQEHGMIVFELHVKDDHSAVLSWEDGNYNELGRQEIARTDFPARECIIWVSNGVIYLPAEH